MTDNLPEVTRPAAHDAIREAYLRWSCLYKDGRKAAFTTMIFKAAVVREADDLLDIGGPVHAEVVASMRQ